MKKNTKKTSAPRTEKKKSKKIGKKALIPLASIQNQKPQTLDKVLHFSLIFVWNLIKYGVVFLCGAIVTLILLILVVSVLYVRAITTAAGVPPQVLFETAVESKNFSITQSDGRKNILILGIDSLENRNTTSLLTDTVMVASVGITKGDVKLVSVPRDLWIASESAKINSLLEKGVREKRPENGQEIIRNALFDLTGLPIHHLVTIDIATVGKIVDALGGLDIDIEKTFIDYQFPRADVDVTKERDPKKLYEVIAFTKGKEHMSGDRVLRFVRSRHSPDPFEGSDDGRVRRQQKVIAALLQDLQNPTIARNPETIGKLIGLYDTHFENQLPKKEVAAIGWELFKTQQKPHISSYQLPIQGATSSAVLYHPERFPGGAWVYLPIDASYSQIRELVRSWIVSQK